MLVRQFNGVNYLSKTDESIIDANDTDCGQEGAATLRLIWESRFFSAVFCNTVHVPTEHYYSRSAAIKL